jgi:hypothetical protein
MIQITEGVLFYDLGNAPMDPISIGKKQAEDLGEIATALLYSIKPGIFGGKQKTDEKNRLIYNIGPDTIGIEIGGNEYVRQPKSGLLVPAGAAHRMAGVYEHEMDGEENDETTHILSYLLGGQPVDSLRKFRFDGKPDMEKGVETLSENLGDLTVMHLTYAKTPLSEPKKHDYTESVINLGPGEISKVFGDSDPYMIPQGIGVVTLPDVLHATEILSPTSLLVVQIYQPKK